MSVHLDKKKVIVENINQLISQYKSVVIFNYNKCDSEDTFNLRKIVKANNGIMKCVKKNLLKRCLQHLPGHETLNNQTFALFHNDMLDSYILSETLCKTFEGQIQVVSAIINNTIIDKNNVYELGQYKTKETSLAATIYGLQGPMRSLIETLKA